VKTSGLHYALHVCLTEISGVGDRLQECVVTPKPKAE